jgi:hypothetical protein
MGVRLVKLRQPTPAEDHDLTGPEVRRHGEIADAWPHLFRGCVVVLLRRTPGEPMNIALWIIAGLLAVIFWPVGS